MMKKINNISQVVLTATLAAVFLLTFSDFALAEDILSSKPVTGLQRMAEDATTALLILGPVVGGVFAIYFWIRGAGADEMDQKPWFKRRNIAGFSGVGVLLVSTFIKIGIYYLT